MPEMKEEDYIRSLHYCPMCGTVVGCGVGGCDSQQFQKHVADCRASNRVKPGRIRFESEE